MALLSLAVTICILVVVNSKSDGDGAFGHWSINAPYNLPFYSYTLDQTIDPVAVKYNNDQTQSVSPDTNATNHLFQFGNDKYVIISSNYGFTQMRQDETGPKFLNDYNRKDYQYGGSNGYLLIDDNVLSTFYKGNESSVNINRNYGFYYRNYQILNETNKISLNHTVIAPFGNDTVSISKITISNGNNIDCNNVKYIEVYSNAMYQLTTGSTGVLPSERREYQINSYNVSYKNIDYLNQKGLQSATVYKHNKSSNGQWLWDETPPITFLSTIGVNNNTVDYTIKSGCELNRFYGQYGAESPQFNVECDMNNYNLKHSGLILELSNIHVAANDEITLYLIYGYVYNTNDIEKYIEKYNNFDLLNNLMNDTASKWFKDAMIFNTNNTKYEWMSRELLWDYGYLRSALTYYNLYNEYIIDQGTDYRYWLGFQGAFRDPLQHALPLIYTNPEYTKSILKYSMKEIIAPFNDSNRYENVPYGLEGNGIKLQVTEALQPSDLELYLLFVASEYILSTKDIDFLQEKLDLNIFGENKQYSVLDCLLQCYYFLRKHINVGKHGIIRLQTGDWNDVIIFDKGDPDAIIKHGESALNTALASYALPKFQQVLDMIDYSVPDLPLFIQNQTSVLKNILFNGEYINRAWIPSDLDGKEGTWLGSLDDGQMYLFPQVWTLLCGEKCLSQQNIEVLINNIEKRLRSNATIGAIMLANSTQMENLGTGSNGGSWYAINHPLVMGLSLYNSSMAFDEWIRNSFYNKANNYPYFWPDIWSSGDSWDSYLVAEQYPNAVGASLWPNYPVFCSHSHAWPLYSFVNAMIGVKFVNKNKLIIQPSLDLEFGSFEFKTKLIIVNRDDNGNYNGMYHPKTFIHHSFTIELRLNKASVYSESININPKEIQSIHWQFYVDQQQLLVKPIKLKVQPNEL